MKSGALFAAGLLAWQMLWLSQAAPRLHPNPYYWWLAVLAALASALLNLKGRQASSLWLLLVGSLAGLSVQGSTVLRCLALWSYGCGLYQAAQTRRRPALPFYLCLLGPLFFFVSGEVVMRVLATSSDTSVIPCLSYGNTLWKTASLYDKELNGQGYRDRDRPQFKPPGVRRWLFLGDSVTFGLGIPLADTFVRRVEASLGPPLETLNLSRPGVNLDWEYQTVCSGGMFFEPDAIIWVFFPNDIEGIGFKPAYAGIHPGLDSLFQNWLFYAYFSSQYNRILGAVGVRQSYLQALQQAYAGAAYEPFQESIQRLAQWSRRNHKPLLIVLFPFMEDLDNYPLREAHQRVAQTAQQLGVPCLDLLEVFQGQTARSLQLNPRFDHHPNARANQLAAQAMLPWLSKYLSAP